MKHVFILGLALLVGFSSWAQRVPGKSAAQGAPSSTRPPVVLVEPEETPWSHVADSVLQHLDKSQIPSGILHDPRPH